MNYRLQSFPCPKVFVNALDAAPVHVRRALFGTLIDSLGDYSLAIVATLMLRKATKVPTEEGNEAEDGNPDLVEFIHQTCHFSSVKHQVRNSLCIRCSENVTVNATRV